MAKNILGEPLPSAPAAVKPLGAQRQLEFDRWNWGRKKCRTCDETEYTITPAGEFTCSKCREKKRMATKTAKPKASTKTTTKKPETPGNSVASARVLMDIDCNLIDVVAGLNPRKKFIPEEQQKLAASIGSKTQLAPAGVRPSRDKPGRYDLMFGERRLRAIRDELKLPTIWCRVINADNELQAALTDDENATQQPLNPIEAAESLLLRLRASGMSQNQFAQANKVSQGAVSNTLRLLELPEPIRNYVISGEIPPAYARALIPFVDSPVLEKAICDRLAEAVKELEPGGSLTAGAIRGCLIDVARVHGRPVNGYYWDGEAKSNLYIELGDDLSPELRARLEVRECPTYQVGKTELRAFNIDAWKEAQKQWEIDEEAREADEADEDDDGDNSQGAGESAYVDRRTPEQKAKEYQSHLQDYVIRWHQGVIAKWIPELDADFRTRLILHFCISQSSDRCDPSLLSEVLTPHGITVAIDPISRDPELLYSLSECREMKLHAITVSLLQRWVQLEVDRWGSDGLTTHLIAMMVAELAITIEKHWTVDEDFLSFHSDEQLVELAKEWKLKKAPTDRPSLVKFILDQVGLKAPVRLLAVRLEDATTT